MSFELVLGAGLEPACLSAYAPQTYVSAIPPPERLAKPQASRSSKIVEGRSGRKRFVTGLSCGAASLRLNQPNAEDRPWRNIGECCVSGARRRGIGQPGI